MYNPHNTMSSIASDDGCSDWASDIGEPTQGLFSGQAESAKEALANDKEAGYDLVAEGERLGLDTYGRMRLVNLIRRDKLSVEAAKGLQKGDWTTDDELLKPVIDNDPLLRESTANQPRLTQKLTMMIGRMMSRISSLSSHESSSSLMRRTRWFKGCWGRTSR